MNQGNIGICTVITEEELSGLLNNIPGNFQTGKKLTFHPQKDIKLKVKHNMIGHDIDGKKYYIEDTGDVTLKISHETNIEKFDLSGVIKQSNKESEKCILPDSFDEANKIYLEYQDKIYLYKSHLKERKYNLLIETLSTMQIYIESIGELNKKPTINETEREELFSMKVKLSMNCKYFKGYMLEIETMRNKK